jgi:hypothetical protein
MTEHRFESIDWFDISLDYIENSEDFELAMELAHVAGFADGQLEADEHNYSDAIYEGIYGERERIIKELEANEHIWRERVVLVALKALINGENK